MTQLDVKPSFEVEVLEGHDMVIKTVLEDGKFVEKELKIPKGWMVYFPSGHSCRIRKEAEMVRLGFLNDPSMIDMESGEPAPKPISDPTKKPIPGPVTKPIPKPMAEEPMTEPSMPGNIVEAMSSTDR